jgi:hypothetical protein
MAALAALREPAGAGAAAMLRIPPTAAHLGADESRLHGPESRGAVVRLSYQLAKLLERQGADYAALFPDGCYLDIWCAPRCQ